MDVANQKSIMELVDNATERSDVTEFMLMGDLSCLDNDFIPAPNIPNADIKYIRWAFFIQTELFFFFYNVYTKSEANVDGVGGSSAKRIGWVKVLIEVKI